MDVLVFTGVLEINSLERKSNYSTGKTRGQSCCEERRKGYVKSFIQEGNGISFGEELFECE